MKRQRNQTVKGATMIIRIVTCHLASLALFFSAPAFARVDAVLGALQGVTQTMQQVQMQQQAQMQYQQTMQMLQQLSPQNQMRADDKFPNCPVFKASTDFPANACTAAPDPNDPMSVQQLMSIHDLAMDFDNQLGNFLTENQSSRAPVGLKCLEDGKQNVLRQIQDRVNNLGALINQAKKETQLVQEDNQKIIEAMDLLAADLYGTGPKKQTPRDASHEFTSSCQNVIGSANFLEAQTNGLESVQIRSAGVNELASHAQDNAGTYTGQVTDQINQLITRAKKSGIGPLASRGVDGIMTVMRSGGSSTNFQVLNTLIASKVADLEADFAIYQRDLADVGLNVSLNDLNKDFKQRFGDFSQVSHQFFTKDAVDKCLTGRDRTLGTGLSTQQILDSLYTPTLSGSATKLENYKKALLDVVQADGHMVDKLDNIKALEEFFGTGEIQANVTRAGGVTRSTTVYQLYREQIAYCEASIANKITDFTDSYATRIERATESMNKIMNLERDFRNELSTALYKRAVDCQGIDTTADQCTMQALAGGTGILSPTSDNFCVRNAVDCSSKVMSCHSQINKVFERKQAEMTSAAGTFNANISGLVAKQEALLTQVKAQVIADAQYISQYFADTPYKIPDNLFVELPKEVMHGDYKERIRGGEQGVGNLMSFPEQLEKLQKMLEDQKPLVEQSIDKHIELHRTGMERERKKWRDLANACLSAEQNFNQQLADQAKQQQEQWQEQQEGQALADGFCNRFRLLENPGPQCGLVSRLSGQIDEVTGRVSDEAISHVINMEYECDRIQSFGEDDYPSYSRGPASRQAPIDQFISSCEANDQDWEETKDQLGRINTTYNGKLDDTERIMRQYKQEDFKALTQKFAKVNYCEAFGYTYNEDDDKCDESAENPTPNACKYFAVVAHQNYGGDTLNISKNRLVDAFDEDEGKLRDEYLQDVVTSYALKTRKNAEDSIEQRYGEQKNISCLKGMANNRGGGKVGYETALGDQLDNINSIRARGQGQRGPSSNDF